MSENSTIKMKLDITNMTSLEQAQYAMKALKKARDYLEFYNKMDTGADVSVNVIKDISRRLRYVRHRLESLEAA